jgi:hypothetical protein
MCTRARFYTHTHTLMHTQCTYTHTQYTHAHTCIALLFLLLSYIHTHTHHTPKNTHNTTRTCTHTPNYKICFVFLGGLNHVTVTCECTCKGFFFPQEENFSCKFFPLSCVCCLCVLVIECVMCVCVRVMCGNVFHAPQRIVFIFIFLL